MSLPVATYLTEEECVVRVKGTDQTLPRYSFVRPIHESYIPRHIKDANLEKPLWDRFNPDTQVYCYCHYGIVALPKALLRRQ